MLKITPIMKINPVILIVTTLSAVLLTSNVFAQPHPVGVPKFPSYQWTEVNPSASWAPRAGLQVVEL